MRKRATFLVLSVLFFVSCGKEKKSTEAAVKMQEFVINISSYAKNKNSNFCIIPQNGVEIAFTKADTSNGLNQAYLNAIDAYGVEGLFYGNEDSPDEYVLAMLQKIKKTEVLLVSDYLEDNSLIESAIVKNQNQGFLCFPRSKDDYNYNLIPDSVIHENSNNITQISEAKNYLYLISSNNFNSKEEMLSAIAHTNFDAVIIDLFFNDEALTQQDLSSIREKANGGKRLLISYMDIGSAEKYRYYWKKGWSLGNPSWLKKKYKDYPDEIWVKYWDTDWQNIIYGNENSYLDKVLNAGFDGVYLDNIEAYYFLYHKQ